MDLLASLLNLYSVVIIGRIIMSWFPISRGTAMESIYSALYTVTEPVLGPVRRAIPPLGGIDLSPIVVIFGIRLLIAALAGR